MKIGVLGNTNNYPFILAKLLKDIGHDVILVVDESSKEKLHRPENHVYKIDVPYPDWIIEDTYFMNLLRIFFPRLLAKKIIKNLNSCDAVILNGQWHGIKSRLRKNIPSISVFSGADLDVYASFNDFYLFLKGHPKTKYIPNFFLKIAANYFVKNHREGIKSASCYSYFPPGVVPNGDLLLNEIYKEKKVVRFNHCHVITDNIPYVAPKQNRILKITNVARFVWKKPLPAGLNPLENKANNLMIEGIALFLKSTGIPLDIHFIEKGIHVPETKLLIKELGFEEMVTWHSEMPFSSFTSLLEDADIIFEQLGDHVFTGGLYPMLIGRPVIANGRLEVFDLLTKTPSPLCQAKTADEVKNWLCALAENEELRKSIGVKSRQYVLDNFDIKEEAIFFSEQLERILSNDLKL